MAVPNSRRVIFGSYVVPQESTSTSDTSEELESGFEVGKPSYTKYIIDPTVRRTLGGKGTVTLTADQINNGWRSMNGSNTAWEMMDNTANAYGDRWEDCHQTWDGETIITGATQMVTATSIIKFVYVENTGDKEVKLAIGKMGPGPYDILIPSKASVSIRTDSGVQANNVRVDIASGTSTIKYIIAQ